MYEFQIEQPAVMTPTGYLKLFELVSPDSSLPKFVGRWDVKEATLDIDATGIPKPEWRAEDKGHTGHHPERAELWTFFCDLAFAGRRIFQGFIELRGVWIDKHLAFVLPPPTLTVSVKVTSRP